MGLEGVEVQQEGGGQEEENRVQSQSCHLYLYLYFEMSVLLPSSVPILFMSTCGLVGGAISADL